MVVLFLTGILYAALSYCCVDKGCICRPCTFARIPHLWNESCSYRNSKKSKIPLTSTLLKTEKIGIWLDYCLRRVNFPQELKKMCFLYLSRRKYLSCDAQVIHMLWYVFMLLCALNFISCAHVSWDT